MYEVLDDLITALDDDYIDKEEFQKGEALITQALKLLNGYIRYIEKTKTPNHNQPTTNNN